MRSLVGGQDEGGAYGKKRERGDDHGWQGAMCRTKRRGAACGVACWVPRSGHLAPSGNACPCRALATLALWSRLRPAMPTAPLP